MKWLSLALFGVIAVAMHGNSVVLGQDNLSIGDFIDTAACYSAIEGSVANKVGDKRMDPESYVNFVDLYGPDDLLDPSLTFEELPLILINNFYFLACMCESESDPECCVGSNAGLETNGALPGDSPTDEEKSYLFVVCAQTNTAIERVIQSEPPSVAPVTGPPVNPFEELVVVNYSIGVKNEATVFEDYEDELMSAMDSMAPTLLSDMRRRQLRAGRRLQTVSLPTAITDNEVIDCPENLSKSAARCESITAYAILVFQPTDEEPNRRAKDFEEVLSDAIMDGDLQEVLQSSTVFIIDNDALESAGPPRNRNSAGIAAGTIVGVMLFATIAYFVTGKRRQNDDEVGDLPVTKDLKLDQGSDDPSANDGGDASSSNAGSSGWSSSAGIDSMNTGSADGLDLAAAAQPAVAKKSTTPEVVEDDDSNTPKVTRDDLDSAIEAGDWAAVGATAALLAAASDSQSYSSKSEQYTGTRSRSGSSVSSLDVARAAELDHLVDAGDWEGVVLAAAKYEGDDSKASQSASISGSDTRSDTAGQTVDSSFASSKGLKQQEYRAIVEDLVQRVVPEEIQNVDEMMLQFRGREDELVETLRTMQERAVAQKARASSQTAAKRQAKSSVTAKSKAAPITPRSSKTIGTGQVSAAIATSKSLGTGEIVSSSDKKEAPSAKKKSKSDQNALEAAIDAGDWDAVGEEAGLLTDGNSLTSADTDEINKFADGVSTDGSSAVGSQNLADVADELEELIEAGDWTGVVQAASSSKATSADTKPESKEARKLRRLKHLQEEQEALAQAEIWTAIAEQSKQETDSTDQGAAEAADWAISRSLNALVEAELSGINDQSTVGTDGDSLYQPSSSRTMKSQGDESEKEV